MKVIFYGVDLSAVANDKDIELKDKATDDKAARKAAKKAKKAEAKALAGATQLDTSKDVTMTNNAPTNAGANKSIFGGDSETPGELLSCPIARDLRN
jgi:hypothetical protein